MFHYIRARASFKSAAELERQLNSYIRVYYFWTQKKTKRCQNKPINHLKIIINEYLNYVTVFIDSTCVYLWHRLPVAMLEKASSFIILNVINLLPRKIKYETKLSIIKIYGYCTYDLCNCIYNTLIHIAIRYILFLIFIL